MTLPTKSWSQLVQDMTASWGAGIGVVPVLSPGDFLLALFEAVAGQLDFLQAQIAQVLALTRASTSTGADLDTWMADFNFLRLPATSASGQVSLGKFQASTSPIVVPAATLVGGVYVGGLLVQTQGGSVVYQTIPDTSQSTYSFVSNTYILPAGSLAMTVTVQSLNPGSSGNVAAGAIKQLGSQSAIDTVTNGLAFSNGFNAESDVSYRNRFVLYLSTLAKATKGAILTAINSVQQGVQATLAENQNPNGTSQYGTFTAFVSNGNTPASVSLINSVYAAVDAVRAFTVQPFVVAAQIVSVSVTVTVRLAPGTTLATVQSLIQAAISSLSSSLNSGGTLFISSVEQQALTVSGVVAVRPGTLINGQAADFVPSSSAVVQIPVTSVFVGQY